MKKLLLITFLCLSTAYVKSQTFFNHGIGLNVGFSDEKKKSISPEYELSILNNNKGYTQGVITAVGLSFPLSSDNYKDDRYSAYYLKGGYRLSGLSFGASVGYMKDYNSEVLTGGWVGFNIIKPLKLSLGADNFNGFNVGLVFYPATSKSNRY